MLLIALGLVLVAIRQLEQPATIERLEKIFGAMEQTQVETAPVLSEAQLEVSQLELEQDATGKVLDSLDARSEPLIRDGVDLSAVRDKTYFRPEERPAWFDLLGKLKDVSPAQFSEQTVGMLTYTQLLQQPEVYRGRVVTLQGTVVREEAQQPGDNPLGIEAYHRLWIRPQGGGQWPFVVYCLRLPEKFPRGDSLRAEVQVSGYFFKNWSYAWDDGLGVAPVVLADQPLWQAPATVSQRKKPTGSFWWYAIALAALCSCAVTWFAAVQTRRKTSHEPSGESLREKFTKLAEEDRA